MKDKEILEELNDNKETTTRKENRFRNCEKLVKSFYKKNKKLPPFIVDLSNKQNKNVEGLVLWKEISEKTKIYKSKQLEGLKKKNSNKIKILKKKQK